MRQLGKVFRDTPATEPGTSGDKVTVPPAGRGTTAGHTHRAFSPYPHRASSAGRDMTAERRCTRIISTSRYLPKRTAKVGSKTRW